LKENIRFKKSVFKDLDGIHPKHRKQILDDLEVGTCYNTNKVKALKGEYKGLFRIEIGDYRVIFTKIGDGVLILRIAHRKEVYR
jgi:mRNA interferase RelE/StbE